MTTNRLNRTECSSCASHFYVYVPEEIGASGMECPKCQKLTLSVEGSVNSENGRDARFDEKGSKASIKRLHKFQCSNCTNIRCVFLDSNSDTPDIICSACKGMSLID